jgi:hypothetical protein
MPSFSAARMRGDRGDTFAVLVSQSTLTGLTFPNPRSIPYREKKI